MEHHVRFSGEDEVHDQGPVLSAEERAAVFYSEQELLEIQQRVQLTMILKDRDLKKLDICSRGLEKVNMTRAEVIKKETFAKEFFGLQLMLRHADAQERENALCQFVASRSKAHEKEAARIAKRDEAAARRVYKDDNIRWTPTKDQENYETPSKRKNFLSNFVRGFRPSSTRT
jgi:hypothetical protein